MTRLLTIAAITLALIACPREPEPTVEGPQAWPVVPVLISVDADVGWSASIDLGIKTWNDAAGCELLRLGEPGQITISLGDVHKTRRGWTEVWSIGDRITRAEISLHSVAERGQAYRVILHELGRSLGLRGALWPEPPSSAMRNDIAALTSYPVRVTHADGAALFARYCR